MYIIFGSISVEQRQDNIDKRQRGTSFSNLWFVLFYSWLLTQSNDRRTHSPILRSFYSKGLIIKFVHLKNYSKFYTLALRLTLRWLDIIVDKFIQIESPILPFHVLLLLYRAASRSSNFSLYLSLRIYKTRHCHSQPPLSDAFHGKYLLIINALSDPSAERWPVNSLKTTVHLLYGNPEHHARNVVAKHPI